jgi:histidinol-phosphate aminotransferase
LETEAGQALDLCHHGDTEVGDGLVDLAVNVRRTAPPEWLARVLAGELETIAAYPDATAATAAVAERHGRPVDETLVTGGAAEAFTLLARALRPGVDVHHPVVVHPQFTEPEHALQQAGHDVRRVLLRAADRFSLRADDVPDEADLVVIGNPTNPTSVLHAERTLRGLARPGRVLVVDEAFLDAVPGEPGSLAGARDVPGLLVVRSLTKTWGLAGLRAGYVLGDRDLVGRLSETRPSWPVSSMALAATAACSTPQAVEESRAAAAEGMRQARATADLLTMRGFDVVPPAAPFVLARHPDAAGLRTALRDKGFAVRRGDTFPGLGREWIRVAARGEPVRAAFAAALDECLAELPEPLHRPTSVSLDPLEVTPCP